MKNVKIILGSLFIILSGAIFEIEKILSYFKWAVETAPIIVRGNGGYSTKPDVVSLSNNYYILLFFVIGLCFLISSFFPLCRREKEK